MAAKDAPAKAYRAGQDSMQLGDYKSAQTSFSWACTLEPDNAVYAHAAAGAACRTGAYREAEGLYRKAIGLAEKTIGTGQPRVALVAYSLVELYENQGRIDEARQLSERVISELDREEALHANCQTLGRLAELFRTAHLAEAGEALFHEALAWREQVFGAGHAKVSSCRDELAKFMQSADPQENSCLA